MRFKAMQIGLIETEKEIKTEARARRLGIFTCTLLRTKQYFLYREKEKHKMKTN